MYRHVVLYAWNGLIISLLLAMRKIQIGCTCIMYIQIPIDGTLKEVSVYIKNKNKTVKIVIFRPVPGSSGWTKFT